MFVQMAPLLWALTQFCGMIILVGWELNQRKFNLTQIQNYETMGMDVIDTCSLFMNDNNHIVTLWLDESSWFFNDSVYDNYDSCSFTYSDNEYLLEGAQHKIMFGLIILVYFSDMQTRSKILF